MAFLKGLLLLPVAVLVVLLAVANRGPVLLSLDPVSAGAPQLALSVPLFVLLFAALTIGVIVGGVASWLAQGRYRRAERHVRRELNNLRQERDRLRAREKANSAPGLPGLPALKRGTAY